VFGTFGIGGVHTVGLLEKSPGVDGVAFAAELLELILAQVHRGSCVAWFSRSSRARSRGGIGHMLNADRTMFMKWRASGSYDLGVC
jgi:hypothetical protein